MPGAVRFDELAEAQHDALLERADEVDAASQPHRDNDQAEHDMRLPRPKPPPPPVAHCAACLGRAASMSSRFGRLSPAASTRVA